MNKSIVIINKTLLLLASAVLYELFCPRSGQSISSSGGYSSKCTFTENKHTPTHQDRFQSKLSLLKVNFSVLEVSVVILVKVVRGEI